MKREILIKEKFHPEVTIDNSYLTGDDEYTIPSYLEVYEYYLKDGKEIKHGVKSIYAAPTPFSHPSTLIAEEYYQDGEYQYDMMYDYDAVY